MHSISFVQRAAALLGFGALALATLPVQAANMSASASAPYGVRFVCAPKQLQRLLPAMQGYLRQLDISERFVAVSVNPEQGSATYSLVNTVTSTGTLYLSWRTELGIADEVLQVPAGAGKTKPLNTVSKKEIVYALLHPGRLTEFRGEACDVQALADQVGVRQNIVMWAEDLNWDWPDGGKASWNKKFWQRGTPVKGAVLHDALNDMFFQQSKYGVGCYTATKIVFAQATLDYYRRIKQDPQTAKLVTQRLLVDGEPLVQIEPGRMWSFEEDFDPADLHLQGKLTQMIEHVAPGNFVPGDWLYFRNTDPKTWNKTGYEGSNAIYLGRNRFDDYYNDNGHHYNYSEKLNEVYQWRNNVFSRSRDWAKRTDMSAAQYEALSQSPEEGGLLLSYRVVPYQFGFEALPELNSAP